MVIKFKVLLFSFHLFIICLFSVYSCITAYKKVSRVEDVNIPILTEVTSLLYNNSSFTFYRIFSGTNTGYGFYGTSVATQKFIIVEVLDSANNVLLKDENFNFRTFTGKSRFDGFPTHISNFIDETDRMSESKKPIKRVIKLREKYVEKIFKYLGKSVSKTVKSSHSYNISLITVLPQNIWANKINKNIVYVEKVYRFYNK